jgi:hypothetical protein
MVNHPNRAQKYFVAFSLASQNALAFGSSIEDALARATTSNNINTEFLIVFTARKDGADKSDFLMSWRNCSG